VTEWATVASLATALGTLVLYGDWEGGQRVIGLFALRHVNDRWLTTTGRHFNVDRPDPR
jgi:hypothetical protein